VRIGISLLLVSTVACVACAELKSGGEVPADASVPAVDASPSMPDAAGDLDSGAIVEDADASAPVHLVFVTTAKVDGSFASSSSPWPAADAICATEAVANSLPGTFVAWISYTDMNGTAFNAGTRIPDVAYYLPGSVAEGGAPVLVAASKSELLSTGPRVQLDRTATGTQVEQDENSSVTWVWTGTGPSGESYAQTCIRWTVATSVESGIAGNARRIPMYTASDWTQLGGRTCDVKRRFYCFQK
jgi:hypothetical protein